MGKKSNISREDTQIVYNHMEGWSRSLVIREMQIKATMKYWFEWLKFLKI